MFIRWATHWFLVDIDLPEEWVGLEVMLKWNSGSEAMVWVNGQPKQVILPSPKFAYAVNSIFFLHVKMKIFRSLFCLYSIQNIETTLE